MTLDIGQSVESDSASTARTTLSAGGYDVEAYRVTLSDTAQARIEGEAEATPASFSGADLYSNA
jgi:hypothetical protein